MERSIFAAIIGGFLGIITLGGLALIRPEPAFESNSQPAAMPALPLIPQPKPEADWRLLDPVTYENISVFPVVASYGQDTSAFLTLEEGLSNGEVIVSEQGAVGLVRNRDPRYLGPPEQVTASVNQLVLIN